MENKENLWYFIRPILYIIVIVSISLFIFTISLSNKSKHIERFGEPTQTEIVWKQ